MPTSHWADLESFAAFYWLLASTLLAMGLGDVDSPVGWVAVGLTLLTTVGLAVIAWRALQGARRSTRP